MYDKAVYDIRLSTYISSTHLQVFDMKLLIGNRMLISKVYRLQAKVLVEGISK
jgi:hypothetical protein